ncbi:MAG TPA: hypothetical protein VEO54_30555 [Thermoanaerobaculia bacterium]|nr:hypothetical protein [Thermoanaerobaculia bacterium]
MNFSLSPTERQRDCSGTIRRVDVVRRAAFSRVAAALAVDIDRTSPRDASGFSYLSTEENVDSSQNQVEFRSR